MAYSLRSGAIFSNNSALSAASYAKYSTPTPELFLWAAVLAGLYLLCCFVTRKKK